MTFFDFSRGKIFVMLCIVVMLVIFIAGTIIFLKKDIGTFSSSAIKGRLAEDISAWQYHMEFDFQTNLSTAIGPQSLLAFAGGILSNQSAASTPTGQYAQSIPVLLYHGILPTSNSADVTTISTFKDQMFALKAAGWQTVSIEDFVAAMQGKKQLPPKSFLLTFDDGRQDAYENATPILQSVGFQAVMYVITGHSLAADNQKSKYYVSDSQLGDMLRSGVWELQSHSDIGHAQYPIDASGTLGDFFGNKLWVPVQQDGETDAAYATRVQTDLTDYFETGKIWQLNPGRQETDQEYENRITTDLTTAKDELQNKLGIQVLSFAYPYNDFAKDLQNDSVNGSSVLVNEVNQLYAVSFYQWYPSLGFSQDYPGADGQLLKRIEPKPDWTPAQLLSVLNNGEAKSLPYAMESDTGSWQDAWGNLTDTNNTLVLSASPQTTGASTILDGSRLWTNYDFKVTFDWQSAQSVSLYARYQISPQSSSFLACNFSDGSVRLENHENGAVTILDEEKNSSIGSNSSTTADIQFSENNIQCIWNGKAVAQAHVSNAAAPSSGGVGVEVWSPTYGDAAIAIHDVTVSQI